MPERQPASATHPTALLDDHIAVIGPALRSALPVTAIRNRSQDARLLLARAALGDAGTLAELLSAARAGDQAWLTGRQDAADPGALAALAQLLAFQDLRPDDRRDALGLLDLVHAVYGPSALSAVHQGLHAQLVLAEQGPDRVPELLAAYPDMKRTTRVGILLDLANPFAVAGREPQPWLERFQALLPEPAPVLLDPDAPTPFDRLGTAAVEPVPAPHQVSVVVPAYRPDRSLHTAVRSILAQTWQNLEVVLVDDGSPPEYDAELAAVVALDSRVRLVKLAVNAGTYAARNAGLAACGGDFVAFQDADDWSHPRRLESQVRPLLAAPRLVATTSDGLSVTDQLLINRPGVRSGRFNPSSLVFRRDEVVRRIGYFDEVRKAGDSEYIGRIGATFGVDAIRHLEMEPLALIRLSEHSLSRAEIRAYWMHPARVAYSSAYLRWHERIAAGEADPYRPRDAVERPFRAPEHLTRRPGDNASPRHYDVVMVADWRFWQSPQRAAVAELRALVQAGRRVAVAHLETYRYVRQRRLSPIAEIQQLVNDGAIDHVEIGQRTDADLVLVRHAAVLQFAGGRPGRIQAQRVVVVADRAPVRGDGTDHRYTTAACAAAARELFGADPVWWPQDPAIRRALREADPSVPVLPDDLPFVVTPADGAGPRAGLAGRRPTVGVDLCDSGGLPGERAEVLSVLRRCRDADIRVRMPDRLRPVAEAPVSWLCFEASDLEPGPFLHQLDFYLHYPHPHEVGRWSQPVLEAAAAGCVVLLPERLAPQYGDVAVYAEPDGVATALARYAADPGRYAARSRQAYELAAAAYHPGRFVARIGDLLARPGAALPVPRGALAPAR
ncbi:glycosyltransferase involved in cell wall biosynthesis [Krasilnikovia cinnamomea]|uniref:Glycosyltransferase involved in cell wall biosynthesis n=1 Tax=Krasilnikovia cinnamomea TaxID=349313 RepID=A0A4Q7ZG60_9ACTN|nr:glycosyltransferase [Krasilnikovia cinnamomea]RZU49772.1 glycosyltransferase involved in cell wall biosynthesis [Krasilnikovia cinnamomea]